MGILPDAPVSKRRCALCHEHGEVEVARRLTIAGQQRGGLAAMLCGMEDEVQQDMPHDTLALCAGKGLDA